VKLPHDLEVDPDYLGSKRAVHRAIEGRSGAIARRLGIPGENGGRILRNLATIERTDKPGDLYRLVRLIEAAAAEGSPGAHAPIQFLIERFQVGQEGGDFAALCVHQLPQALLRLHGAFGALLQSIDRCAADGEISAAEAVDNLLVAQKLEEILRELVARLQAAARVKKGRSR
jgi:hypothetical protein